MRTQRDSLGSVTGERVDQLRQEVLDAYMVWIETAKSKGECVTKIPTDAAALYFDAQNGGAMRMQKEGVDNATIATVLKYAFEIIK
jgi:hypothetical protein